MFSHMLIFAGINFYGFYQFSRVVFNVRACVRAYLRACVRVSYVSKILAKKGNKIYLPRFSSYQYAQFNTILCTHVYSFSILSDPSPRSTSLILTPRAAHHHNRPTRVLSAAFWREDGFAYPGPCLRSIFVELGRRWQFYAYLAKCYHSITHTFL